MLVKNETSSTIIVFSFHKDYGRTEDTIIFPGKSADISGPRAIKAEEMSADIYLEGMITCQATPDKSGYHVSLGNPLVYWIGEDKGIVVRHPKDRTWHWFVRIK